jgi:ribosomal protein L7Ae-like RNA K-turn-binding protein
MTSPFKCATRTHLSTSVGESLCKRSVVIYLSDADTFIYQQVVRTAEEAGIPCVRVGSMKELGILCGLDVPAAAAGILK